jgi:hypothetical protein
MATAVGRVPVRLRIGVTGHRALPDEQAIAARVDDVLARLQRSLPSTPTTPVLFEVVSPLGEGADRIVAERVLQVSGAILEVPLPLARSNYEQDFGSAGSRERFNSLLERAHRVWVVGGHDRVDAYRETGIYVVDSCDLLIAVWDGLPSRGPGGTADVVDRAQNQAMPVFRIGAEAPFDIQDPTVPVARHLILEIERFNDADARPSSSMPGLLPTSGGSNGEEAIRLKKCLEWVDAHYRRAAIIANRARRRFTWGSRALFLLSAFALLAAALSVTSDDETVTRGFAYVEVALIVAALVLWLQVRHRLHDRWITSRFLTERLRSAAFLAFAGGLTGIGSTPEGERGEASQEWISRVFREIWRTRPRTTDVDRAVDDIKDLLTEGWVARQLAYYEGRAKDHLVAAKALTIAGAVLFCGTILSAGLHASELVHGGLSQAVAILTIALPAFAASLAGIAGLELHARHAARFRLMARRLGDLQAQLGSATELNRVREIAVRIETELRTESEAWIDVMRFQDVELPS